MHFLLVNDDGIGAPGIMALLRAAVRRGHTVSMCAPKYQQSAASHRFTLIDPLYSAPWALEEAPGCEAWAITGTPADCVRIGLSHLVTKKTDAVISGINWGYNSGTAVHYSGTVGAAMEGVFHNLPSIATSIQFNPSEEMLLNLADYTIGMAEKYAGASVPRDTLLNINAPALPPAELKEPVYCPLDTAYFLDGYIRREAPRIGSYYWLDESARMEAPDPGSDNDWLNRGHITLTLIGGPVSHDKSLWNSLNLETEANV